MRPVIENDENWHLTYRIYMDLNFFDEQRCCCKQVQKNIEFLDFDELNEYSFDDDQEDWSVGGTYEHSIEKILL